MFNAIHLITHGEGHAHTHTFNNHHRKLLTCPNIKFHQKAIHKPISTFYLYPIALQFDSSWASLFLATLSTPQYSIHQSLFRLLLEWFTVLS